MRKSVFELSLIFGLVAAIVIGARLADGQSRLSDKLIRLHIVANSDSAADQTLKLRVRDRVCDEAARLKSPEAIAESLDELCAVAREEVRRRGYSYPVTISLGREKFPTRRYDTFSLPAGEYTACRIVIGEGAGKNWWCVMFPPLCVGAALPDAAKGSAITEEEIALMTGESAEYEIKFAVLELFGELFA